MAERDKITLTRGELKGIVKEAIEESMMSAGMDLKNPIELQQDMAALRRWREAQEKVTITAILKAVGVLVVGALAFIAVAIFPDHISNP